MTLLEIKYAVLSGDLDLKEHDNYKARIQENLDWLVSLKTSCEQSKVEAIAEELNDWVETFMHGMGWTERTKFICLECTSSFSAAAFIVLVKKECPDCKAKQFKFRIAEG
jgi:hypothetical protein